MRLNLTHEQFARDWALGQFYFHVMAAYAILRKEGVDIGKADYVPHMFGYLRAASATSPGRSATSPSPSTAWLSGASGESGPAMPLRLCGWVANTFRFARRIF